MRTLYNIAVGIYTCAIRLASPFHAKAKAWVSGRRKWQQHYTGLANTQSTKKTIWFHCASLGEFEMARPLIEELKRTKADEWFILVSFFSPSGYQVQHKYPHADAVVYLPADTPANSRKFVAVFNPAVAVFVKYEVWINYIDALKKQGSAIMLMNAVFRPGHRYFRWYGGIFRRALKQVDKVFVQEKVSQQLLARIGVQAEIAGDTRYDRVLQIKDQPKDVADIEKWIGDTFCIVCGSTWPAEERIIAATVEKSPGEIKWIIAPHDVSPRHIEQLKALFKNNFTLYSNLAGEKNPKNILLIDGVGKLSQVYSLARLAVVGGGFSGKLHNVLEPAVYGIPVLFGPWISRFKEAVNMEKRKTGFTFFDDAELLIYVEWFFYDKQARAKINEAQKVIFEENTGAVNRIMAYLDTHARVPVMPFQ